MSVEQPYQYDEPLGIYGYDSKQRLGWAVVREFTRYQGLAAALTSGASLDGEEAESIPMDFRLSSLVADDEAIGHVLAITPAEAATRRGTEGVYYQVQVDGQPKVTYAKSLFVTHASLLKNRYAWETDVAELTSRFDKNELEAVMRMASKLTAGLTAVTSIGEKKPEESLPHRSTIQAATCIEPRARLALQEHNLIHLAHLYPAPSSPPAESREYPSGPQEAIHISEWNAFTEAAQGLFRRETDGQRGVSTVALRHEVHNKTYYVKLAAAQGELTHAQILCDDMGAWQSQLFDLSPDYEEGDADLNIVGPMWDKEEILEVLRDGELIQDSVYEDYRSMAAKCLEAAFEQSVNLVQLPKSQS